MPVKINSSGNTDISGDVAGRDIIKPKITIADGSDPTQQAIGELKQTAGVLVEILGSYNLFPDDHAIITDAYSKIKILGGKLREYPAITQVVREVLNSAGIIMTVKGRMGFSTRQESEDAVAALEQHYQGILLTCNSVLGKSSPDN